MHVIYSAEEKQNDSRAFSLFIDGQRFLTFYFQKG